MAYTIDTHATIRELETAGIEHAHAEAIVTAISRADSNLATKADLAALEANFKAALESVKISILIALIAVAGVLFTAIKLFG